MQVQDVLGRVRILLVDMAVNGRYSETELISLFNDAQTALVRATKWPASTLYGSTVAGQQEYQLPEIERLDRVYIAGQPIIPTSIPLLQGDQLGYWDQSATNFQTQWQSAPAASYPVSSYTGGYNDTGVPYFPGQRPQYYLRGAQLGLVPAPSGVYPMVIDCIAIAPPVAADTDYSIFPSQAKDALAYWIVTQELFADGKADSMQIASGLYSAAVKELRETLDGMNKEVTRAPIMRPYRGQFRGRLRRTTGSSDGGW